MIYGIGTDIAKVSRFEKWVNDEKFYSRFFGEKELAGEKMSMGRKCEHYAARFAAKEAFAKALGTGFRDFDLKEVCTVHDELGKPILRLEGKALELLNKRCGENAVVHLSITHEKEYAVAFVVIEKGTENDLQ